MKRQFVAIGLVVFALLLFALISATLAAPGNAPLLQTETEDNDTWDKADLITTTITGVVSDTDQTDWFKLTTNIGTSYQATVQITDSGGKTNVAMRLYREGSPNPGLVSGPVYTNVGGGDTDASLSWSSIAITYYVRIDASLIITGVQRYAQYTLNIDELAPTPIPTSTPIPSQTPIPTSTPPNYDNYWPNNTRAQAYTLPVATSVKLSNLLGVANFLGGNDWFKFWAKDGKHYEVTTSSLSDCDTRIEIYKEGSSSPVKSNDDGAGGYASKATFQASDDTYYYVKVENKVSTSGSYDMTVAESTPSTSPTATPGPGPDPKADGCEHNYDFEHACVIAPNDAETFNFVPKYGGVDNDYFKIWVKPGFHYECYTSYLDTGVDPNMIVYTGPSESNAIGGNDDRATGDFNSYFSYYSTYDGWLYVLVGYGNRTPSDIYNSNYTLQCDMSTQGQPAATGTPRPTSPPRPTSTPRPEAPTPTPPQGLTVRSLTTPVPGVAPTVASRFVPVTLLIYYDANDDQQPGAGEGVVGISAQAHEATTNQLLAQGFTDSRGSLEFTVAAQGPVRVSVPFFGFSQLVAGEGASIRLRVPFKPLPAETP